MRLTIHEETTTIIELTGKRFLVEEETTYTIIENNDTIYRPKTEREMQKIIQKLMKNA